MAKHSKKKHETQVIEISKFQKPKPIASIEYEEEEPQDEERLRKFQIPKLVYRVGAVLLVLVLGLVLWMNRDHLRPENISSWVRLQFMGDRAGDGFPVSVTGSQVLPSNFDAYGGDVLILSDTAFTMVDPSGRELAAVRHSLNTPVMRTAGGKTLLYNEGSTGYQLLSGGEAQAAESAAPGKILRGAVAANGRFALGTEGSDGASELTVYQADGSEQYHYLFARDYITALALNYDGSYGAVASVRAEKGALVSKITIFYFNDPNPVAEYETQDNLLLDLCWTEGGEIFALGENALLRARSSDYRFSSYSYEGRRPTAYRMDQGRLFLSISAYDHAGPCTLLVFRGEGDPLQIECGERVLALSSSGGSVAALTGGDVVLYDFSSGRELGRVWAGADAKSVALASESLAYVLGVSEIRTVDFR